MNSPSPWIEAARPRTLPAAVAPVLVGTAAASTFALWRALAALLVSLAIQIAVNFANDLFDGVKGVDSPERVGPRRAVAAGLISPKAMKMGMIGALTVAAAAGLALAIDVGYELLAVGALCFIAALAYSGGSRPYASRGLGELFVFIFFGLVATVGSQYVQDGELSQVAYVAAIPVGLLASAILVVNNLRDIGTDEAAGKRTLAVKLGDARTRKVYQALVVIALLYTFVVAGIAGSFLPLLALAATPFAVKPVLAVLYSSDPQELIAALGGTARLQLVYSVLLAVGLWGLQ